VLDFSSLTRNQAAALVEVTVEHFMDGRGEDAREVRRIRLKLANKIDALELLGKHHKLYVERHQHDWSVGLADRLDAALARVRGTWRRRQNVAGAGAPPQSEEAFRPVDRIASRFISRSPQ
jgi:hypothetical protein